MQQTIFAKQRTSKEGKKFHTYFTTLKKSDGTELTTEVKFKEECGAPDPKACPMNIVFEKEDANFSEKSVNYTDANGEEQEAIRRKLWISKWSEGEKYVHTSMDDFV